MGVSIKMNRALQVLLRGGIRQIQPTTRNISTSAPKNGSGMWIYRESGLKYIPKKHMYACEAIGALMWWWMLIHIYHEPDHILVSRFLFLNTPNYVLKLLFICRESFLTQIHPNG